MKSLIDKLKEGFRKRIIDNKRKNLNIDIAPAGKCYNSRFEYSEEGIDGKKKVINSMRYGVQDGNYPIMINAVPKGSVRVTSGKKEIVTSRGSPDGSNRIILEKKGKKIKYDAVVRFIKEHPAEHMYFLKGDYVFTRKFTPSMGGGKPIDKILNPTNSEDLVHVRDKSYSNKLQIARLLIEEMENEVGREIVNKKYYDSLSNRDFSVDYISKSDVWKFIPNNIYY